MIVGGPPCQGFSNAGKRKEADPRNQLYKSYLSFVESGEPKILLIENVAGIASKFSKTSKSYKDNIIANLQKDYHVDGELLTSNIFGVPQKRKRYIIIGLKKTAFKDKEIDISEVFKKIKADSISFTSKYSSAKDSETFDITNTNVLQALSDIIVRENLLGLIQMKMPKLKRFLLLNILKVNCHLSAFNAFCNEW